jgi:2TM family of unknown function (DUF5676)
MNNNRNVVSPRRLGVALGTTGVAFYLGCRIMMSAIPRAGIVIFFNSLLHGFDVAPILRTSVPPLEVLLGLVSTFVLGWLAGAMVAAFYNWGAGKSLKS